MEGRWTLVYIRASMTTARTASTAHLPSGSVNASFHCRCLGHVPMEYRSASAAASRSTREALGFPNDRADSLTWKRPFCGQALLQQDPLSLGRNLEYSFGRVAGLDGITTRRDPCHSQGCPSHLTLQVLPRRLVTSRREVDSGIITICNAPVWHKQEWRPNGHRHNDYDHARRLL